MLPKHYIEMTQWPLSAQGKIDRSALPKPDEEMLQQVETYVAPKTDIEKQLCSIWERLLSVSSIGLTHNFFQSGGDSLLAVQLTNELEHTLNISCKTKAIFD